MSIQKLNEELEAFLNEEKLYEMANVKPIRTNLKVIIWADSGRNLKHAPRIKFQNSYSDHVDGSSLIPMTISENPEIPVNIKLNIKQKDVEQIRQWVILNKDLLMDYFTEEIDTLEFMQGIRKV